ncbi:MAG TPA: hypothetical protein VNS80_07625 [Pseudolysinimonas sp.]|nr:hypothetical protein [Pseudolysinimonas sp.]
MTTTLTPEIGAFAAAVRAELVDLTPDQVDDLTDGLEADLSERLADAPDEGLGDPIDYAAELRAAAGHPPRPAHSHLGMPGTLPALRGIMAAFRLRWRALVQHPVIAGTVAMLVALRPVWWVLRGIVVAVLLLPLLVGGGHGNPMNGGSWLMIGLAVILSVQVGRGRWLRSGRIRKALVAVNVIVVVAAPFLFASILGAVNEMYNAYNYEQPAVFPDGLSYNGTSVGNIYAYDAEGNPIDQVQLFDQFGDPLNFAGDPEMPWTVGPHDTPVVPSVDVVGRAGWNIYPLGELIGSPYDPDVDFADVRPPSFPFESVKPLSGHEATPDEVVAADH